MSRWFDTIRQDIPRTFSELKIFQSFHEINSSNESEKPALNMESMGLMNILCCWTVYREDIGYRQGMSQIAGYLMIELSN